MRYENFYDPIAHLVIDDFFTEDEYNEVFSLINYLKEFMVRGVYISGSTNNKEKLDVIQKYNFNVYLSAWPNNIACQRIKEIIETKFWSYELRKTYLTNKDSMFQYHHYSNLNEIMISKYPKNGHYDWHRDINRSLTGNIMISNDQIEGGNFYLKSNSGQIKEIEFKSNRVIFFPAECQHMVSPVTNDAERFSIQYFTQYKKLT